MTKVANPLDKSEVKLQENEELVDLLTELDNKPEEESKAADNNQETAETEEVAEATEEVENTETPKLEGKYSGKSI